MVVLGLLLVSAGVEDARTREIANWKNAAIALLAPLWWWANGLALWPDVAIQLGMAAIVFAIFVGAFAIGQMGGGDVKMIAACSVWLGLPMMVPFLLYTAIAGGALAAIALVARRIAPAGVSDAGWTRWLTERKSGVPYGIAIAAGAIFIWSQSVLGAGLLKAVG